MRKSGPKPTPTKIKELRGNPGKRPLNELEPQPSPAENIPPDWLTHEKAIKHWNDIVPMLRANGIFTELDVFKVGALCEAFALWREHQDEANRIGHLIKAETTGAVYENPLVAIANRYFKRWELLCSEFGMSPAMRTRLMIIPGSREKSEKEKIISKYFTPKSVSA